jgi:hypothetical protein
VQFNEVTEKELILQMLLAECIRRLSKNGKHKVSITNRQLEMLVDNEMEVDFSESNDIRFILKYQKMQDDIEVIANVVVPREKLVVTDESVPSE